MKSNLSTQEEKYIDLEKKYKILKKKLKREKDEKVVVSARNAAAKEPFVTLVDQKQTGPDGDITEKERAQQEMIDRY